jgi:hypothetical protein
MVKGVSATNRRLSIMYLISSIQSSGFFVQGSGFSNYDDLVESHEFNYRWLSRLRIATPSQGKKVHIPPPNHGGIKRRRIFSGTRLYT